MKLSTLTFTLLVSLFIYSISQAQIIDPKRTAERKVEDRASRRIDQGIDKGLDKIEGAFKKKDKNNKGNSRNGNNNQNNETDTNSPNSNANPSNNPDNSANTAVKNNQNVGLRSYSKFDFIPGEQVIAFEDFSQGAIGDFPAKWNTNASGEVVTLSGQSGKWMMLSTDGYFYPEFLGNLPDNFTLEMDIATSEEAYDFDFYFVNAKNRNLFNFGSANLVRVKVIPQQSSRITTYDSEGSLKVDNNTKQTGFNFNEGKVARLSMWRQNNRLRVYVNEQKVWDIPRAFENNVEYRFVMGMTSYYAATKGLFFTNMRVAVGAPDTRNKLITEGKLVSRGITFDVNSDKIKPESFGILKEIAQVLNENAGVRVKIIGHTDSDGDANANIELSKRRATAVKNALASEFGVDASRLETDGKGAAEPSEPNTTPQGKANNRRVEFIKL